MPDSTTACQEFEVAVYTSPGPTCGTFSRVWLSLIGSQGETPPISVNDLLLSGSKCLVHVRANGPLGQLLLVRLRLEVLNGFPNLDWHCSRVEVCRRPAGQEEAEAQVFHCDRWLQAADGEVDLRSGNLCLVADETEEKLKLQRFRQLQHHQELIRWRTFIEGAPACADLKSPSELGPNLSFTTQSSVPDQHYLKGLCRRMEPWKSFSELEVVFAYSGGHNQVASFAKAHWKEDWYFGYQCLNGCNPLLVRQTRLLPPNLGVTSDMLHPFLPGDSTLELELQKGTIYLLDYEVLDSVPANIINGKQTYLSAPLCLLHLNSQGQLVPIAIQLQQKPDPQNPIFLPSDSSCDWLLAKMWVHNADFQYHQLISHYLRTHVMSELCCIATLRQLAESHPLHQLLMPHVRTSLKINLQARAGLLASGGVFDQAVASGLKAIQALLSRASARIRYRSLCVPDDLLDRGVHGLPHSYYAEDAHRVWDALYRFVVSWVDVYYSKDDDVQNDLELHQWITEINTHGYSQHSGFPQSFCSKAELSKFVTMIIFSCSALHAAVNFSQLDFALWVPNCPTSMVRPPPQVKGVITEDDILGFLPDVNITCRVLMVLSMLSQPSSDFIPLCCYRENIFKVGVHRRLVEEVQAELRAISDDIRERNSQRVLPYPYLSPSHIENSVAI
ncbi:polyunsaturated fatty acid lipoxygenase ALOX15B [Oryzias melastigma]|uniref:Zgc:152891 n=1 Tax=Oryzias melastigma TaxID=30732 RepID=A0A3B3DQW4_ORYME|nr:polyunsaturated fatty acid lipoxygenase ALOX15B [Oryzias melastigma]